jgi:hypothetical protein
MGVVGRGSTVAAAALALYATTAANGGTVLLGAGWEASWDASLDPFVDIQVDGIIGDTIFIQKSAEFTQGPNQFGVFPAIPIAFRQIGLSNIAHIVINDEIIFNNTGVDWADFHIDLLDSGDAVFNPAATAASGGDGPIGWTIAPFTQASFANGNTTLNISGGIVAAGSFWFPGDGASDGELWIDVISGGAGDFTVFTLKETPTIPAPGALALIGLAGLLSRNRRRR